MSKEDRLDRLNLVLARDSDTEGDTFDTWDVEFEANGGIRIHVYSDRYGEYRHIHVRSVPENFANNAVDRKGSHTMTLAWKNVILHNGPGDKHAECTYVSGFFDPK